MAENQARVVADADPGIVYATAAVLPATNGSAQQPAEWACPRCSLLNPARKLYCIACFHRHQDLTPPLLDAREVRSDEEDGNGNEDYDADASEDPPFPIPDEPRGILATPLDSSIAAEDIPMAQGEEDPYHKKIRRRVRRKKRMIAGGVAGGVAGAVLIGPAMLVAGAVGGVVGTRIVSKQRERSKDERLARERYAMASGATVSQG